MHDKLTKADLIETLHASLGFHRHDIHRLIGDLMIQIKRTLLEDNTIELRGLAPLRSKIAKAVLVLETLRPARLCPSLIMGS